MFLALSAAWPSGAYVVVKLATSGGIGIQDVVLAAVLFVGLACLMPVFLIVRTKTVERVLSIDEDGIKTTIGMMRGEIPWSKVAAIEATEQQILFIGTTPNFFAIPSRAFDQASDRKDFVDIARNYWTVARGRAAV